MVDGKSTDLYLCKTYRKSIKEYYFLKEENIGGHENEE